MFQAVSKILALLCSDGVDLVLWSRGSTFFSSVNRTTQHEPMRPQSVFISPSPSETTFSKSQHTTNIPVSPSFQHQCPWNPLAWLLQVISLLVSHSMYKSQDDIWKKSQWDLGTPLPWPQLKNQPGFPL